jgi:1-acyl-sn-glycerol-3-phosphate acyltransferase
VKIFLVASIEERARRRREQLLAQGIDQSIDELVTDIARRDAYDSGRAVAPLRKADDAVEIDTTGMTIAEVIEAVRSLVEAKRGSPASASAPEPPAPVKWFLSGMVRSPLDTRLYRFAFSFIPTLWRLVFRMRISGQDNIPLTGPVLLASNHRSNLDPFFVGSSFPRQVHFMAKAELWKFRPLGRIIDLLGTFPVHRGEADRAAVKRALEVLGSGAVVGMFPEGRRQRDGLGDIHPGVALFSLREGVVTVPMVLEGTERVIQRGLPRFPRVTVTFGPPLSLPADDLPRARRAQLITESLTQAYQRMLDPSRGPT